MNHSFNLVNNGILIKRWGGGSETLLEAHTAGYLMSQYRRVGMVIQSR